MQEGLSPGQLLARAARTFVLLVGKSALGVLLFGVGCVLVGVVIDAVIGSHFPNEHPGASETAAASRVEDAALLTFGQTTYRIQIMGADDLKVYLERRAFESVAFPDRDAATELVSAPWCDTRSQPWLLPAVAFLDIRSGEVLAKRRCLIGKHAAH